MMIAIVYLIYVLGIESRSTSSVSSAHITAHRYMCGLNGSSLPRYNSSLLYT